MPIAPNQFGQTKIAASGGTFLERLEPCKGAAGLPTTPRADIGPRTLQAEFYFAKRSVTRNVVSSAA